MRRSFWRSLALVFALLLVGVDAPAVGAASPGGTEISWDLQGDFAAVDSTDITAQHRDASIGWQVLPAGTVAPGGACTYEYRSDFARPPPTEVAANSYGCFSNILDPAADGGRVLRVYSGLVVDRVAPSRPVTDILRYDPDFAVGQIARGGNARASDLVDFGASQGWRQAQTATGPIKFVDQNGVTRLTIKSGSPRAPGSGSPHIEIRNAAGERIDVYGNAVTRRSPGNHTPIIWDLG